MSEGGTVLYGAFSMTLLSVAYLFPCKGITGQFFVALFCKINNPNGTNSTKREKNEMFLVSIVRVDLEKLNI